MRSDIWEWRSELLHFYSLALQRKDKQRGGCCQSETLHNARLGNVNAPGKIKRNEIHSKDSKLTPLFKKVGPSGWPSVLSITLSRDSISRYWPGVISSFFPKIIPDKFSVNGDSVQRCPEKSFCATADRWEGMISASQNSQSLPCCVCHVLQVLDPRSKFPAVMIQGSI